jgi:hypothetical protein
MPGSPDISKTYLSAAQLSATTNAKTMQYEAQLAHYAQMADSADKNRELREREFNITRQTYNLAHEDRLRGYQIKEEKNQKDAEDKARDDKWRERKYGDAMDAKDGFMGAFAQLDAEGLYQGMKGYDQRLAELTAPYRGKIPNQIYNTVVGGALRGHSQNAVQAWSEFHQLEKSYNNDRQNTLYGGSLEGGDDPLLNQQTLKPEMKSAWTWNHPWKPDEPTGKVLVPQPGGAADRPVAVSELTRLNKMRTDLQTRKSNLPETSHRPELGAFDEGREPPPPDPAKRENNKVYLLPKGQFRWVNGQWVDP